MRGILRPFLLPFLRRNPDEVEERARHFRIEADENRVLVAELGRAFLGGYNAMLDAERPRDLAAAGMQVDAHFRPFYFEGAAMGYLPRALFSSDERADRAEADLLALDPRFRYLYYVGIGFWYGFRHRRNPGALERIAAHFDPVLFPLAYDGFGFKVGFFDFPASAAAREVLERGPARHRPNLYQGFGRALHFVYLEDEAGFERERKRAPAERRSDMEAGRSLALAFTGARAPERILQHVASARDDDQRGARLLGVTWALTAREMNDREHFERCLAPLAGEDRALLRRLTAECREAFDRATTYDEWRTKTKHAAEAAWAGSGRAVTR